MHYTDHEQQLNMKNKMSYLSNALIFHVT